MIDSAWENCRKGSCHRHAACMYAPCKAVAAPDAIQQLENLVDGVEEVLLREYEADQKVLGLISALRATNPWPNTREAADALQSLLERCRAAESHANDENEQSARYDVALGEAKADIAKLRAALKPFAEAAADLDDNHADLSPIWESAAAMSITAKDLLRACEALATPHGY